ncbi:MAG: glycosyltransferase family 2 protein [Gammaproteobacteria bacterium]|nr:glycosyltransferase family 2 protein [Gammaproteobacteria bacterium]
MNPTKKPKRKIPIVTVIIPTYKRAQLVPRAIESVRRQSVADLEILVIDDCSPDDTESVVRAIADERIRYIRHSQNRGLPSVRNTGIRAARGKYIAFLDDDDEWRQDKIEKQLIMARQYDAVLCGALVNGTRIKLHPRATVTLDDLRRGNPFDPSGLLVKTRILKKVMFDEQLRQGEDWDAFIRLAQCCSIGYVAEPLVLYSDGGHQRMTNEAKHKTGPELETRTAILKKHRSFFGNWWFRYYFADTLMSYLDKRRSKLAMVIYAVKRCGIAAVLAVMGHKVWRHIRQG